MHYGNVLCCYLIETLEMKLLPSSDVEIRLKTDELHFECENVDRIFFRLLKAKSLTTIIVLRRSSYQ